MTVGLDTFLQGMTDEEWRAVEARTKQLIAGNLFTGRMAGRGRKLPGQRRGACRLTAYSVGLPAGRFICHLLLWSLYPRLLI